MIRRLRSILRACTHLHTLFIDSTSDLSVQFDTLFAAGGSSGADVPEDTSGPLSFPLLRNLRLWLSFGLDESVLDFLKSHNRALRCLRLYSARYRKEQLAFESDMAKNYTIPPLILCAYIECSPFLVSALVPGSQIEHVKLYWPIVGKVDKIAHEVVQSLSYSQRQVKTVVYSSCSWNIDFMRGAAHHLPSLQLLYIKNVDGDRDIPKDSQDHSIVSTQS